VLEALEKGEREGPERSTLIDDLPLFSRETAGAQAARQKGPGKAGGAPGRCIPTR
jgi:hypothetical protein